MTRIRQEDNREARFPAGFAAVLACLAVVVFFLLSSGRADADEPAPVAAPAAAGTPAPAPPATPAPAPEAAPASAPEAAPVPVAPTPESAPAPAPAPAAATPAPSVAPTPTPEAAPTPSQPTPPTAPAPQPGPEARGDSADAVAPSPQPEVEVDPSPTPAEATDEIAAVTSPSSSGGSNSSDDSDDTTAADDSAGSGEPRRSGDSNGGQEPAPEEGAVGRILGGATSAVDGTADELSSTVTSTLPVAAGPVDSATAGTKQIVGAGADEAHRLTAVATDEADRAVGALGIGLGPVDGSVGTLIDQGPSADEPARHGPVTPNVSQPRNESTPLPLVAPVKTPDRGAANFGSNPERALETDSPAGPAGARGHGDAAGSPTAVATGSAARSDGATTATATDASNSASSPSRPGLPGPGVPLAPPSPTAGGSGAGGGGNALFLVGLLALFALAAPALWRRLPAGRSIRPPAGFVVAHERPG